MSTPVLVFPFSGLLRVLTLRCLSCRRLHWPDIAAHPDVVCAYFEMLNQALRCAPQSVAPLLTPSFSLALVSLSFPGTDLAPFFSLDARAVR